VRVLIADKFEQSGLDGLKAAGCEVSYQAGTKDQALADAVAAFKADVLVVRSTTVTEAILAAGDLKLVVRARGSILSTSRRLRGAGFMFRIAPGKIRLPSRNWRLD
jgi:D-3-phosphoglycerate dehydrogenase